MIYDLYKSIEQVYYIKVVDDECILTPILKEPIKLTHNYAWLHHLEDGIQLYVKTSMFGKSITIESDYDGMIYVVLGN